MAADHHEDTGLGSSLTDLMTSLAVIFILLFVATQNNERRQGQITLNRILIELQEQLNSFSTPDTNERIVVELDKNDPLSLLVIVPQGFLNFATDESMISDRGHTFIEQFAPKLASTLCSDRFKDKIGSIVVEGHADPRGTDEHNIPLSQSRATAVVIESLATLDVPEEKECFTTLLSASGRGKGESKGLPLSPGEMARIRRVQFKIRVRSQEERELRENLTPSSSRTDLQR
ncbi:MAG: OmpA family protein [Acidobacteria bacterium]|nr:OmpA family protein [Acidobacteriota bacterium]